MANEDAADIGRYRNLQILLILAAVLYVFVTPPFQVPDETQHFARAYEISTGHLLASEGRGSHNEITYGFKIPRGINELEGSDFPLESPLTYKRYNQHQISKAWSRQLNPNDEVFTEFANVASYPPTLYAPQALGILTGRLLGLPPLGLFYFARLINALVGVGLIIAAIKLAPFGSRAFLGIASLPTTLYETASVSPDATVIGLTFVAIALSLRCLAWDLRARDKILMLLLAPFLGLAKGIYLPLQMSGLGLLNWRDARAGLLAICAAIGVFSLLAWMTYSKGTQVPVYIISKTNQLEMTAPLMAQLHFMLIDLPSYAATMWLSFADRLPVYLLQIVGRFGWNAFLMPLAVYILAAIVLASSLLNPHVEAVQIGKRNRLWWASIFTGGVVLIETALYLTSTPFGAHYIQGTQGRYFIPYLPLLLLSLSRYKEKSICRSLQRWFPVLAAVLIISGLAVAFYAFWIGGYVKYTGIPPFSHNLIGLVRAFLLPSGSW